MSGRTRRALVGFVALAGTAWAVGAQQPAQRGPQVGDMAPDFSLGGVTRYGILRDPVTLSSYRGHTVVLAFFVKARTRG